MIPIGVITPFVIMAIGKLQMLVTQLWLEVDNSKEENALRNKQNINKNSIQFNELLKTNSTPKTSKIDFDDEEFYEGDQKQSVIIGLKTMFRTHRFRISHISQVEIDGFASILGYFNEGRERLLPVCFEDRYFLIDKRGMFFHKDVVLALLKGKQIEIEKYKEDNVVITKAREITAIEATEKSKTAEFE